MFITIVIIITNIYYCVNYQRTIKMEKQKERKSFIMFHTNTQDQLVENPTYCFPGQEMSNINNKNVEEDIPQLNLQLKTREIDNSRTLPRCINMETIHFFYFNSFK